LGRIKLIYLRPDHIQSFYNSKLEGGSSARTVRLIHSVLHRALNLALQWGLVGRNPSQMVAKPKPPRAEMQVFNDNQVRSLLMCVAGSRWEALFQLAVTTGLREGELLGLRWSDLDWTTGKLHMQRQLQRISKQGLVFSEPNTAAGKRVIPLGPGTQEKVRAHL